MEAEEEEEEEEGEEGEEASKSRREIVLTVGGLEVTGGVDRDGEGAGGVQIEQLSWDSDWLEVASGHVGARGPSCSGAQGRRLGAQGEAAIVFGWRFNPSPQDAGSALRVGVEGAMLEAFRRSLRIQLESTGISLSTIPRELLPLLHHLSSAGCLQASSSSSSSSSFPDAVPRSRAAFIGATAPDAWHAASWPTSPGAEFGASWGRGDTTRDSSRVHEVQAQLQKLRGEKEELEQLLLSADAWALRAPHSSSSSEHFAGVPHRSVRSSASVVVDVGGRAGRKGKASGERAAKQREAAAAAAANRGCCNCQRRGGAGSGPMVERLVEEARGIRRAMHTLTRGLLSASASLRSSLAKPWPVVIALFTYAAALHIVIAMLLHSMAGLQDHRAMRESAVPELAMAARQSALEHSHGGAAAKADVPLLKTYGPRPFGDADGLHSRKRGGKPVQSALDQT